MTASRQDSQTNVADSASNPEADLLTEARQLGAEILALIRSRLPSERIARAFFDEVNRTVVTGLSENSDTPKKAYPASRVPSASPRPSRQSTESETREHALYGPANPRTLRIDSITQHGAGGCQIIFENEGSGLSGRTGDLAALCPRNDPDQVRQLLRAFNLRGNETILRNNRSGPAWRILLEDVAIGSISNAFREALREQITTRDKGLIIDEYIRAAKPNLVALLRHFPTLGKCFEEFVEHSEPLLPQKGCVVKSLNVRDNQLRVLLPESVHRGNASGCVPLETGAWVPVYIEQRDTAHVSDNGELPLIIVTDPFCAQVAVSYLAERQQLGHRGRTWIVVFGSHIDQTLRSDLEQLQLSGSLTRVDFALEVAPNNTPPLQFSSPMFWRWFVDRSAFHVVGVDNPSTMELERSILDALVTSSGKAADWFVEPLMERRASGLYRTMTLV